MPKSLADTLLILYRAAENPSRWAEGLIAASDFLDADAMMLLREDPESGVMGIEAATGFDASALRSYERNHLDHDELIAATRHGPVDVIASSRQLLDPPGFPGTGVFKYLLRPSGLHHIAVSPVTRGPGHYASLWMARADDHGDFTDYDHRCFLDLLPHVRLIITISDRLRETASRAGLAFSAFDRVGIGIVLLDLKGLPIMVNREARRIADERDGFLLEGAPSASLGNEAAVLRRLIRRAGVSDPSTGGLDGGGGSESRGPLERATSWPLFSPYRGDANR